MIIVHAIEFLRLLRWASVLIRLVLAGRGQNAERHEHVNSVLSSLVLFVYSGNRMVAVCAWLRKDKKPKRNAVLCYVMLVQYNWTHYLCYFDCDDHDLFVFTHLDWSLFECFFVSSFSRCVRVCLLFHAHSSISSFSIFLIPFLLYFFIFDWNTRQTDQIIVLQCEND